MSADATATATVPYVDILREYYRVQALSTAERVQWKNTIIDEPELLAGMFERSIDQLEAAFGGAQVSTALNSRDTRSGPKPPPKPVKVTARNRKTIVKHGPKTDLEKAHEILYSVFEAGGVTVSGAPQLAADYAGYSVAPLRIKGDKPGKFDAEDAPEGDPGELLQLDLLLQSRDEDALPIIGEFKYGDDIDPMLALLEALTFVALLATPSQFKRLRKYFVVTDEDGDSPRFDEHEAPRFDIYLFVAGHRRNAASQRSALWDAVPWVIDALLEEPIIAKHVRRIEGVKVPLGGDARVQLAGNAVLGKPVVWEED
jgi:hypothetical protein